MASSPTTPWCPSPSSRQPPWASSTSLPSTRQYPGALDLVDVDAPVRGGLLATTGAKEHEDIRAAVPRVSLSRIPLPRILGSTRRTTPRFELGPALGPTDRAPLRLIQQPEKKIASWTRSTSLAQATVVRRAWERRRCKRKRTAVTRALERERTEASVGGELKNATWGERGDTVSERGQNGKPKFFGNVAERDRETLSALQKGVTQNDSRHSKKLVTSICNDSAKSILQRHPLQFKFLQETL
jgi:hypothetical protein